MADNNPFFTAIEEDIMGKTATVTLAPKTLADKAMLVRVKAVRVPGSARDEAATSLVEGHYGVSQVGSFGKKLFKTSLRYKAVTQALNNVLTYWRERTAPWMDDGFRLLPSDQYMQFVSEIRTRIVDLEIAVKDFETNYDNEVQADMARLGGLANPDDYPADISGRFGVDLRFQSVPDNRDWRVSVLPEDQAKLDADISVVKRQVSTYLMGRIAKPLGALVAKLAEYKGEKGQRWHGDLVTNLSEVLDLVPALNLDESAEVDETVSALKRAIEPFRDEPEALKHSETKRDELNAKLKAAAAMDLFM